MKERKGLKAFIASTITSAITLAISIFLIRNYWMTVILTNYGKIIAGLGVAASTYGIYVVVFLPVAHILNKIR